MPFAEVKVIIDLSVRGLCCKPYPGHPKGCPCFGKKLGCPPQAPIVDKVLDLSKPVIAVYNAFDLGEHVRQMLDAHPSWSDRQLACCLYWQPRARRELKAEIRKAFNQLHPDMVLLGNPEAAGVNVTATMETCGIYLNWPPQEIAYQVSLIGFPSLVRELDEYRFNREYLNEPVSDHDHCMDHGNSLFPI